MNPSPENSPRFDRSGRIALMTAAPLAVLAFVVYAFSGLHAEADASSKRVSAPAAPAAAIQPAPSAAPARSEDAPVMRQHDAELLDYRPHGG